MPLKSCVFSVMLLICLFVSHLVELLLDFYKHPLDGVRHKEHQQDCHARRAVVIALQAVGNDIADAARANHAEDGAF